MPFLGEVELANLPLSVLSILMGLANGFNFCTAWIFVYLLSIIVALKDKKKTRILVGSFLISSGILYYLFLAAWLNVFLFIGYLRILNLLIGSSALYFGVITICEFVKNNQDNKIGIEPVGKVKELVGENISFVMLFGIMFLAFTVGSTNFSCSATLPATYTYMLTKANLSIIQYYAFILLYTVMYMLDDLLMFSCAIFALNNCTGKKYKKYSAMIGGILMLLIGISVVFFPNLLR
jgi:hypothetical protein